MFWERFRSSVLLVIITLITVIMGGNLLFGTILLITLIGLRELYQVGNITNTLLGFLGYLFAVGFDFLIYFQLQEYNMVFIICFLMILMLLYVFSFPKYKTEQITLAFFGFFYVVVMMSFIYQVRSMEYGLWLVWLIFIGAWGSDTCAYCVGVLIGKHKMSPKLSPKKSIEGGVGGILGAALIGVLYAGIAKSQIQINNPYMTFAIIGACASIISQIGDLAASAIKRDHDIKDYGHLIPGHGGILDRFDSILFTAPIVYFLADWLV